MLLIKLGWGDRADIDVGEVASRRGGGWPFWHTVQRRSQGGSCVDSMSVEAEDVWTVLTQFPSRCGRQLLSSLDTRAVLAAACTVAFAASHVIWFTQSVHLLQDTILGALPFSGLGSKTSLHWIGWHTKYTIYTLHTPSSYMYTTLHQLHQTRLIHLMHQLYCAHLILQLHQVHLTQQVHCDLVLLKKTYSSYFVIIVLSVCMTRPPKLVEYRQQKKNKHQERRIRERHRKSLESHAWPRTTPCTPYTPTTCTLYSCVQCVLHHM